VRTEADGASYGHERLAVVDFGAQYGQLICRRARELGVFAELVDPAVPLSELQARGVRAVILSGGPDSVLAEGARGVDPALWRSDLPVLGICYGAQLMARDLGGRVAAAPAREFGPARVELTDAGRACPVTAPLGLAGGDVVWMSHADRVEAPPPGHALYASTPSAPAAAFGDGRRIAVQFHPEVVHTPRGAEVLAAFLHGVAGLSGDWTMASFAREEVRRIRQRVGDGRAIVALSGGVDSAVAAALAHRALGDRLTAIFVDHGLLRLGEADEVGAAMAGLGVRLVRVEAADRFLSRLAGVTDPEAKRRIVGEQFVRVFEAEARRLGRVDFLVQGTLYPDVVESGDGRSSRIKSHHNVGGLPADLGLGLVEPLRLLFKDEVRRLARELGLGEAIAARQPFPGPGLAVRVAGEVTAERLDIVRQADAIVRTEVEAAGLAASLFQYFAALLPVRAVGVMGDRRTYGYAVVVRAVTSEDGMTGDWARLGDDLLARIASRIGNEVEGVGRVLYDLTTKPPGTIEWE
jgi:GMP synthase (glutamine-hydrolysing)